MFILKVEFILRVKNKENFNDIKAEWKSVSGWGKLMLYL